MPLLPAGARAAPGTGTVFAANERDASISAIDLASGRVSSVRIPVAPHTVDAAAGGRLPLGSARTRPGTAPDGAAAIPAG